MLSCFKPNLMTARLDPDSGLIRYTFEGRADYTDPSEYGCIDDLSTKGRYQFLIPCGRCLGCQIDYSREWANRMIIELQDSSDAIFVTLTYNDLHLSYGDTGNATLNKRDVQLFFKRLRKCFPDRRIRYYIAGEYGPSTLRPHYHAIIYGLGLSDFPDLRYVGHNDLKQPYYSSLTFEKTWSKGFVQMSEVSYRTCAYVARYVLKKHYSDDSVWHDRHVLPEFNESSRKPGIGMMRAAEMVQSGFSKFAIPCVDGVREVMLPKPFLRHCKNAGIGVDKVMDILYNRQKESYARLISTLLYTDQQFVEYLRSNEFKLAGKISLLPERK